MQQIMPVGGAERPVKVDAVQYGSLGNGGVWDDYESVTKSIITTPGTLKRLIVELDTAPGNGGTYTFAVRKNGVTQTLSVAILDPATSASDLVNTVAVVAGDTVSLICTPSASPAPTTASVPRWSTMFEGTNAKESLVLGGTGTAIAAIRRHPFFNCNVVSTDGAGTTVRQIIPTGGTIKNLYVELREAPGAVGSSYTLTLYKSGIATALAVTITHPDTTGNNVADTVDVVAGEDVWVEIAPGGVPTIDPVAFYGFTFKATIDGESLIMDGGNQENSIFGDEYQSVTREFFIEWDSIESHRYALMGACTLKKWHVEIDTAPGAGHIWDFYIRKNVASTALHVQIADANTSGNDAVNSEAFIDGDEIDWLSSPGTGVLCPDNPTKCYMGVVGYIGPSVIGPFPTFFRP
jgi:hypothetical protein